GEAAAQIAAIRQVGIAVHGRPAARAADVLALLLAFERDQAGPLADTVRAAAAATGEPGWIALAALVGSPADVARLRAELPRIVPGEQFPVAVALAARVAVEHADAELAEWATPRLCRLGGRLVVFGFGTIVLGP